MSEKVLTYKYVNKSSEKTDEEYQKIAWKLTRSLGVPPKYNMDIDPQYTDEIGAGFGRIFSRTILSNPTIISICPGSVKMFPNFKSGGDNGEALSAFKNLLGGNWAIEQKLNNAVESKWTSKLFTFQSNTAEYAKYLNVLCRASAIMMGIGTEKMPNTSIDLKYFDYAYWTYRGSFQRDLNAPAVSGKSGSVKSGLGSIWTDFWKNGFGTAVDGLVSDSNYVHFFVNNQETSISEQIQTSVSSPPLVGDVSSKISSISSGLNYFIGSGMSDDGLLDAMKEVTEEYMDSDETWKTITNGLINGGQLVFPEMLSEATYNKDIRCSFDFISPYGDPLAVFLNCTVPAMHLLAFALPKQISDNMYTYPFVVRVYQQGNFNSDLAIISNIELNRGGDDSTHWTIDGLSTSWNVSISVTPLYTNLMMSNSDHPFRFMKNEGLLEYLGNLCGLDLKANNLETKKELFLAFLFKRVTDIPTSLGRRLGDAFYTKFNGIIKFFR